MSTYKQFLFWALAHLDLLAQLASLVQAVVTAGTFAEKWNALKAIGDTLLPALSSFPQVEALADHDEAALEVKCCEALNAQPVAQGLDFSKWDGSRLKLIWSIVGPLVPVLIGLLK